MDEKEELLKADAEKDYVSIFCDDVGKALEAETPLADKVYLRYLLLSNMAAGTYAHIGDASRLNELVDNVKSVYKQLTEAVRELNNELIELRLDSLRE